MRDMNQVMLVGRLGGDPIQRETKAGLPVVNFSLATKKVKRIEGAEPQESTEWHRIVVWGKSGEACAQHLKRGSSVMVQGSIRTRTYQDKEGVRRTAYEVHASEVSFLGTKRKQEVPENEAAVAS